MKPAQGPTRTGPYMEPEDTPPVHTPGRVARPPSVALGTLSLPEDITASKAQSSRKGGLLSELSQDLARIEANEILWGEQIGSGNFGTVHKAKIRGKVVAVKRLKKKEGATFTTAEVETFEHEMHIMRKAYHPNTVMLLGFCTGTGGDELMMVTELLFSDLESLLIKQKRQFPLVKRLEMAREAALGMNWLHLFSPKIIHRDLKLSNLLVDEKLMVKVADFGLTRMMDAEEQVSLESRPEGTPLYMAPEIFNGNFDEKCDVYSFAIVLWELVNTKKRLKIKGIFCKHAYADKKSQMALIYAVSKQHHRPELPADLDASLASLLQAAWHREPKERPPFSKIESQLESIIVELSLPENTSRAFWSAAFGSKTEVNYDEFEKYLRGQFEGTFFLASPKGPISFKCLRMLVATETRTVAVVNILEFGRLISRFGPLQRNGTTLLEQIYTMLSRKWFHGNISKEETSIRLKNAKPGTFLVRFSETQDPRIGYFAISYIAETHQLTHIRVATRPEGGFKVGEKGYVTFDDLIQVRPDLKEAAPGSQFQELFPEEKPVKMDVGAYGLADDST